MQENEEIVLKTFVGLRTPAKNTVEGIINTLNKDNYNVSTMIARGRAISIAIDMLEMLKRKLMFKSVNITSNTIEMLNSEGFKSNVSEMIIKIVLVV